MANSHSLDLELSSSQYAYINDASQTGLDGMTNLTIEAWIKLESLPSGAHFGIVSKWKATDSQFSYVFFLAQSTYKLAAVVSKNGQYGAGNVSHYNCDTAFSSADLGVWHHVAMVFNSSNGVITFYIDGSAQTSTIVSTYDDANGVYNSSAKFEIGMAEDDGSVSYYDGLIDDVRVWNTVRSDTDISNNRSVELAGNESGLVGYWKLNNNYDDTTSNNNDLTSSGSPVFSSDVPNFSSPSSSVSPSSSISPSSSSSLSSSPSSSQSPSSSPSPSPAPNLNTFSFYVKIDVDHTKVEGTTDFTDYVLMYTGTHAGLKTVANGGYVQSANGYDILFFDNSGNLLDYEIEQWDATTGKIAAHVRIPTLYATQTTTIYLYAGNDAINLSYEDQTGTWNSNYKVVYHFNNNPAGGSGAILDSTSNNVDATSSGSMTSGDQVDGLFGKAIDLDGTDDYVSATESVDLDGMSAITVEAIVKPTAVNRNGALVVKGDLVEGTSYQSYRIGQYSDNTWNGTLYYGQLTPLTQSASTVSNNTWAYIAITWDSTGKRMRLYKDGTEISNEYNASASAIYQTDHPLYVGKFANSYGDSIFQGLIEEVRISTASLSADYLKTQSNNYLNAATFYTAEEHTGSSASSSVSLSQSASQSPSSSPSASQSPSSSQSLSPSLSQSASGSSSPSPSSSISPSPSTSESRSVSLSVSVSESRSVSLSPSPSPSAGDYSISLTDITSSRIFPRNASNQASVTVSGSCGGGTTYVQARVVNDGTSTEVVGWTTIDNTVGGGTFSGTITVPQGGWYNVQVRVGDFQTVTSNGSNKWGVGVLVGLIGQSNIEYWFNNAYINDNTLSANDLLRKYNENGWGVVTNDNDGAKSFGNTLIGELGIPVGLLDYGVGGTSINSWYNGGYTDNLITGATAVGGIEYVIWAQGETDAETPMSESTYKSRLESLITYLRSNITCAKGGTLPVLISLLGKNDNDAYDAGSWGVRSAQLSVIDEGTAVYQGANLYDQVNFGGGWHWSGDGYIAMGERLANTILYILGESTYYKGPSIYSASQSGSDQIIVTLSHSGGTDFTPTSGIGGFRILDGSSEESITTAVRTNATRITLTISGTLSGVITLQYGYNGAITESLVVVDNSTIGLPLEYYDQIIGSSPSSSQSRSPSSSQSPSSSISSSQSLSISLSPSSSPSQTSSSSPSSSVSPSESSSSSSSCSLSPSSSQSQSSSESRSISLSPSRSGSSSSSSSVSPSPSPAVYTDTYERQNTVYTDLYRHW